VLANKHIRIELGSVNLLRKIYMSGALGKKTLHIHSRNGMTPAHRYQEQVVVEPLPTRQALHFGNFLKQLEPRLVSVQLQIELQALQWSV